MLAATCERFLTALAYPDYRRLWFATMSARAASWALIVARGWLAYEMTGSSFLVGLVTFMAMAPRFFANPIAGFLADRFDRRTVLCWTYALELANNGALATLTMLGLTTPWVLVLLSFINGSFRASEHTSSHALVPNLIPRQHLLNAVALAEATQQGSRLIGPLAIAPLLAWVDVSAAFWLCSAFFGVSMLMALRIRIRSRGELDRKHGFGGNFVAGFVYAYQHPTVLAMILLAVGHCSLTMSYESMLPAISQEKLEAGALGVSYMIAGVGLGAMLAAMLVAGVRNDGTRGWLLLVFAITSGLGPLATTHGQGLLAHTTLALTPERVPLGRSTWLRSPVTTMREFSPSRVRNIFICTAVVFWASSRMAKALVSVRPRMKASGATSISPLSRRFTTCGAGSMS